MNYENKKSTFNNYSTTSALFTLASQLMAQICFNTATNYNSNIGPSDIISEDFNNDGHQDIVTCNYNGVSISLLLNNGSGGFLPKIDFPLSGPPVSIACRDFDYNNYNDLAIAIGNGTKIIIMYNGGGGNFSFNNIELSLTVNPFEAYSPIQILSEDFNNDGWFDLATINGSNNVTLIMASGINFLPPKLILVGDLPFGTVPSSFVCDDFNNDNKKDFAISSWFSSTLFIYTGDGVDNFTLLNSIALNWDDNEIINGDFNNDNTIDLAVSNIWGEYITILTGIGTGNFTIDSTYVLDSVEATTNMATCDLNNDDNLDIIAINNNSDNISVLIGNGDGKFIIGNNYSVDQSPYSICFSDFNGDNKIDIATGNGGNNVSVLLNCTVTAVVLNNDNSEKFTISPNPFQNYITLNFETSEIRTICIFNTLGGLVFEKTSSNSHEEIELSEHLSSGLYTLRVEDKTGIWTSKMIKN